MLENFLILIRGPDSTGIMSYEDAVRMLAILENPKPQDMSPDVYNVMLDDLVASKFTYIVASQVQHADFS